MPKILGVWISSLNVTAGDTVKGRVATSSNVGYVEARVESRNQAMHQDAPGKFSLSYQVPWQLRYLPFLHHEWTLQVIARSIDGVEVKRYYPLVLH
jgi:hypothetical protein